MQTRLLAVTLMFLAAPVFAQPVITSISPTEGPTSGGTEVTITGRGFEYCPTCTPAVTPHVTFGGLTARSVKFVSSTEIRAVTPARPSGGSHVIIEQYNGSGSAVQLFRYTGPNADAFERVLLPVLVPPIPGAFGSDFRSRLRIVNHGSVEAIVNGIVYPCRGQLVSPPCPYSILLAAKEVLDLTPEEDVYPLWLLPGRPGRFADISKDAAPHLAMNLRAYDTSRAANNFGTEMPIVRDSEFRDVIYLTGVPLDPRFRLTLRIYGTSGGFETEVTVNAESQTVSLRSPQAFDIWDPAYAEITLYPPGNAANPKTDIIVRAVEPITSPPLVPKPRIWAFITVTNNETQHITTITPQPSR